MEAAVVSCMVRSNIFDATPSSEQNCLLWDNAKYDKHDLLKFKDPQRQNISVHTHNTHRRQPHENTPAIFSQGCQPSDTTIHPSIHWSMVSFMQVTSWLADTSASPAIWRKTIICQDLRKALNDPMFFWFGTPMGLPPFGIPNWGYPLGEAYTNRPIQDSNSSISIININWCNMDSFHGHWWWARKFSCPDVFFWGSGANHNGSSIFSLRCSRSVNHPLHRVPTAHDGATQHVSEVHSSLYTLLKVKDPRFSLFFLFFFDLIGRQPHRFHGTGTH